MISNSYGLLGLFIALVLFIQALSRNESTRKMFKYLPVPLWCYFLPTVFSTLHLIPSDHVLYGQMSRFLLPACLFLLLVGTDLVAIYRLSPKALLAMACGSFGILLGGMATFLFLAKKIPEFWKGWACLSASWTGGSANMIAVKEILGTPESLFSNLIIVDTIIAYSWMAVLVFASKYQAPMNRWLGAEDTALHELSIKETFQNAAVDSRNFGLKRSLKYFMLLAFGFSGGIFCWFLSGTFPQIGTILNRFTWTVICSTAIPLVLSTTPVRQLEDWGASQTGNFLLYLLLTSIGSRANLAIILEAPSLIALGFLWVILHGIVLAFLGKLFRIPVSLLATASQANVGGTVSTPIVASVYDNTSAPVGLILAVLGNIYGTAFGLFFAQVCRWLNNLL